VLGFGPGGANSVKPGAPNPSALDVLLMLILGCSIVASCKTNRELVNKNSTLRRHRGTHSDQVARTALTSRRRKWILIESKGTLFGDVETHKPTLRGLALSPDPLLSFFADAFRVWFDSTDLSKP
jgi:hypothetical protein